MLERRLRWISRIHLAGVSLALVLCALTLFPATILAAEESTPESDASVQDPASESAGAGGSADEGASFSFDVGDALTERVQADAQASSAIITSRNVTEIIDSGYLTLSEYLSDIPGFFALGMSRAPGARGLLGSVNFMVDGVSYTSPLDYRYPAGLGLFLEEFERVDVISGPAGVPWGAHSLLGVVNVLTGSTSKPGTTVRAGYGVRDLQRVSVRTDTTLGDGEFRLFAGYSGVRQPEDSPQLRLNGSPPYAPYYDLVENATPSRPPLDQFFTLSARYRGPSVVAYLRLPLQREWSQRSSIGAILPEGQMSLHESTDALGFVTYQKSFMGGEMSAVTRLVWYSIKDSSDDFIFPTSAEIPNGAHSLQQIWMSDFALVFELSHRFQTPTVRSELLAGAEGSTLILHSSMFATNQAQLGESLIDLGDVAPANSFSDVLDGDAPVAGSVYIFDELRLWDRLSLAGGSRLNGANTYAKAVLYQGSVGVRLLGQSYLKLGYTEGFRPPTLIDRQGVQPVLGSRRLIPEESKALQLEANSSFTLPGWVRNAFVRADYSRTLTSSNIQREGVRFAPYVVQPVATGGYGIETLEGTVDLKTESGLAIYGAFQRNIVREAGNGFMNMAEKTVKKESAVPGTSDEEVVALQVRPNHGPKYRWALAASYEMAAGLRVSAYARGQCRGKQSVLDPVAGTIDEPNVIVRTMGCYTMPGLMLLAPIESESLTFAVKADNLLDVRVPAAMSSAPELNGAEAPGLQPVGRTIFFSVTWASQAQSQW